MLELLKSRRSIRKYKDKKVEQEKVDILVKSALLSPSSKGIYPWEFVVVDDTKLLTKLADSKKHGARFLQGAPLAFVVFADKNTSDVWVEDTSIASTFIHLAAHKIGLGSCWIQIRNRMYNDSQTSEDYIKELLNLPPEYRVESIIAIGYPAETKSPYGEDDLQYDKVYKNEYGENYF